MLLIKLNNIKINIMNAENRNNIAPRMVRRCSFCRQPGHTVSTCNNDILLDFETNCACQVTNMNQPEFNNWLIDNYDNNHRLILKSFAIKKCGCTLRSSIPLCIERITIYIFRIYKPTIINNTNLEYYLINLFVNLRNVQERNETTIEDILRLEANAYREFRFDFYLNYFLNGYRSDYLENTKLNICSTFINEENNENCECNICWEEKELNNFVKLGCNHEFCKDCLIKILKTDEIENPRCALCRADIISLQSRSEQVHSELGNLVV